MSEGHAALVWCPFPDKSTARSVATQLLSERLIACANMFSEVEAVFEWEGKADSAIEVGVLFKTTESLLDQVIERLGELHPYEIPAIIGWTCDAAHPDTLTWLRQVTMGSSAHQG